MWTWTLGLLLLANALSFGAMGLDKRRSRRGGKRIPERHLLLLALPLASPGTWLGSRVFRHKTRKWGFRVWLSLVTVTNALLVWALAQAFGR